MAIVDKYISHITPLGSPDTYKLKAYLLKNGRTFKVKLNSANASTAFDGSANITDIGVSGILSTVNGGTGNNLFTEDTLIYANTATKLASYTFTRGGTKKLWYLNAGVPTDSIETVGDNEKPIYLNTGTITAGLPVWTLANPTQFIENESFNDKTTIGNYYISANAIAATIPDDGKPGTGNIYGTLKVSKIFTGTTSANYLRHDWFAHSSAKHFTRRTNSNAEWSGWSAYAYIPPDTTTQKPVDIGGTEQPIYVKASGELTPTTYYLKANIDNGTQHYLTMYTAADGRTIGPASDRTSTVLLSSTITDTLKLTSSQTDSYIVHTSSKGTWKAGLASDEYHLYSNTKSNWVLALNYSSMHYRSQAFSQEVIPTANASNGIYFRDYSDKYLWYVGGYKYKTSGNMMARLITYGHDGSAADFNIVRTAEDTPRNYIFWSQHKVGHEILPLNNDSYSIGSTSLRWQHYYGTRSIDLEYAGETGLEVNNTAKTHKVAFISGSSGNAGIYDRTHGYYLIKSDQTNGDTTISANTSKNILFVRGNSSPIENARFNASGHFIPGTNNTFSLGLTETRWTSGFFTTSLRVGAINTNTGTTATTRSVYAGPDGFYANSVDVTSATQSNFVLRGKGIDYAKLYIEILGVADTAGRATFTLGNSTASTAANNAYGKLILYSQTTKYSSIESSADIKGHHLNYLPIYNETGTSTYYGRLVGIYKGTSSGSTSGYSDVGSTSQPVYVTANGVVKAISLKPTLNNLLNSLTEGTATALADAGYIISSNNNGDTSDWYLRSNDTIWYYIKGKYSSTDTTLDTGPIHIRSTSGGDNALIFDRASGEYQYIQSKNPDNSISIVFAASNSDANTTYRFTKDAFYPKANNSKNLGLSGNKWANVYATNFNGALKGNADTATAANITSTDNAIVRFNGTAGAFQNSNAFVSDSGSITAGTFTANTATSAEIDVKAASGAGTIYLYSAKTITGNRGIWLQNAGGESSGSEGLLVVNQDNNITTHAPMATSLTVAASNTYNLGASGIRWKAAFIGTADSYGSVTNPIYWNNGIPVATNPFITTELVHYCDQVATTLYYVTTSITVTTSSNCWIYGTITGTKGTGSSAGMDVRFQVYWNKSTLSAAYYQDSTNAISEMTFYTDSSYKVYFSFACTQYSRVRITVLINNAVGNANYATAISTTAPATFSITKKATKVASTSAVKTTLMPNNSTAHYILGVTGTAADSNASIIKAYRTSTAQVYFRGDTGVLMGAAWNDYAEYRQAKNNIEIEPGRVVKEVGDETLELTTERLQRGCSIVSNTFGISIGESDVNKLPLAVSGRVLAYPYEDREEFKNHIGWPVCSGPNGTVSIMTEEEEIKYPSRIIGTISAVPDYEIWHGGAEVIVDGRVWIKVR